MQTGNIDFIYRNEFDKACFQHDMAYEKLKDLTKRAQSDKILRDKAFKIASDPKYDGYQRELASMVHNFFDKKSSGSGFNADPSYQLENKLHKQIIRRFKERKVYSSIRENGWGVNLADMQSLSKYNKGIKFLLCAIDLFNKYVWVISINDKKGVSIVDTFQKNLKEFNRKPNNIWVDKGSEFYNNWLKDNDIEMYSIHN